jgi:hypothetical protein
MPVTPKPFAEAAAKTEAKPEAKPGVKAEEKAPAPQKSAEPAKAEKR